MAEMDSATTRTKRRSKPKAREAMPCYSAGAGASSFTYGMPEHELSVVDAALAILGRYLHEPRSVFDCPRAVRDYLRLRLGAETAEVFAVMYLDAQHAPIAFETPFFGTINQTAVYPREIARAALAHNASAVIFAHNHPTGRAWPSISDEKLTATLKAALQLVDVRVLDHMIVTGREVASMAEMGLV